MMEMLSFEFMRNAFLAGLLVSVVAGVVGTLLVVNRMVFIAGGVAHASFGGIGLALFAGLPPLFGAGIFAVAAAFVMGALSSGRKHRVDTVIGAVWATGMAAGIVFIDLTPGYGADLMSYLFGSIMTVTRGDLLFMSAAAVLSLAFASVFHRQLIALSFDEEFAALRNVPVRLLNLLLLVLASLAVVVAIRAVGLILVIALLSIPQYLAERFVGSIAGMMALSTVFSAVFTGAGLVFSYRFNLSSGAAIIMVAAVTLFAVLGAGALKGRFGGAV